MATACLSEALALLRGKDKELRHFLVLTQILPMDTVRAGKQGCILVKVSTSQAGRTQLPWTPLHGMDVHHNGYLGQH